MMANNSRICQGGSARVSPATGMGRCETLAVVATLFVHQVAERLRAVIAERGYSINRLEAEMGFAPKYLGDALVGRKRLTLELLGDVLAKLEVTTEEFFAPAPPTHSELREQVAQYLPHRSEASSVAEPRQEIPREQEQLLLGLRAVLNMMFPESPPPPPKK